MCVEMLKYISFDIFAYFVTFLELSTMSNPRFRFDVNAAAFRPCATPPARRGSTGGPPPGRPPGLPPMSAASNSWSLVVSLFQI